MSSAGQRHSLLFEDRRKQNAWRSHPPIRIGISGWRYPPWRGVFYPPKLPQRKELQFAAEKFSTIEINGTFYSLQRPTSFATWASQTPPNFQFAVKGPRYITHMLRLRYVQAPLANFFASGVLLLGEKLVEWPKITDVTSHFVYCRLHGSEELYASGYDSKSLDQWAEWVRAWVVAINLLPGTP